MGWRDGRKTIALTCRRCGNIYETQLYGDGPKSKHYCGMECKNLDIKNYAAQCELEKPYEPLFWMDRKEPERVFERFRQAYVSGVSQEDLIDRFGPSYWVMARRLPREDRAECKAWRRANRLNNTGKMPEMPRPALTVRNNVKRKTDVFYEPRYNGVIGYG